MILDKLQACNDISVWRVKDWQEAAVLTRFAKVAGRASMHHKFAVIDRRWAITGSMNWTGNGEGYNHENLFVLDSPELSSKLLAEFERIPVTADPPAPKEKKTGAKGTEAPVDAGE